MKKNNSALKKIKNPKRTQVVVENLSLDDFINEDILKVLKKNFEKHGKIITTEIRLFIVPGKKNKGRRIESIILEQPSPKHTENKKTIITSSNSEVLNIFLKK
ncbi:hypothetical protein IH779_03695 [Patescibacteria group bacterium]|nr:hypothetical protein [Patescibacteria group bacterium]